MLYWAEGDSKINNPCRFNNTNSQMIALYTKFLTKTLNVPLEKLRIALILYPDLSIKKCISFWAKITGISNHQFYKPQVIKGRHPTKRLINGICMVVCNSRQLKEKINL